MRGLMHLLAERIGGGSKRNMAMSLLLLERLSMRYDTEDYL